MFTLFRRQRAPRWDLRTPLLRFSSGDTISLGDLYTGTQIFGSTGSGKTSGSMAEILRALMRAGAGGLFLSAKSSDRANCESYAQETGRNNDVRVFGSPDSDLRFNFINSAMLPRGAHDPGLAHNLTALLMTVADVLDRGQSRGGRDGDAFFRRGAEQFCRNGIEILARTPGGVTVPSLLKLITSAPTSPEQLASESWVRDSHFCRTVWTAEKGDLSPSARADLELAVGAFANEWAPMSSRTRSGILSTLTGALDPLSRGMARDLLSSPVSNLSPEMCWEQGAIVIVDVPALVFQEMGRVIGVVMKHCWQQAAMRRDVSANHRPMFIAADESHLFAAEPDWAFQAVARGTCTATVYATQSLSNYLEAFGPQSEARVHSLLGNLQLQLFHQQTDVRTIAYAQELIGRRRQMMIGGSTSLSGGLEGLMSSWCGGENGATGSFSEVFEHELQARDFHTLAKGGPQHKWIVEALLYQGGRTFKETGRTWRRVAFRQRR